MNITLNATDRKPLVKAISELTGEKAEYHYNGESVARIYYNWKLNSFRKEYEEDMICVNGGSDGWSISEENIKEVLKR